MSHENNLLESETLILQGNEASVEGALAAGCRFFAGYPITPASEISERMSRKLPAANGVFMQMEDELASINAIIGARWGGSRSMTATSGAGFSLMLEGLGYAIVTETPTVIVDVQRGGPSTGQPTLSSQSDVYQARYGTHGDYELIVYAPSSVQEMYDHTFKAFSKAEEFRVPVIVLADEIVAHMREKVQIPSKQQIINNEEKISNERVYPYQADKRGIPPKLEFFQGYSLLIDGQLHDERGIRAGHIPEISSRLIERLNKKITNNIADISDINVYEIEDAETIIIAYGSVSRSAHSAVRIARNKGIKIGMIKINTIWPFPENLLVKYMKNAQHIFIPEMNIGKYYREIRGISSNEQMVVSIPLLGGFLHKPDYILQKIEEVLNK